ncbi:MAG: TIGR00730 family Rossman fold protein [Candidatus Nomurabacteria bacterium]|jgi:uncharacterized protein (TIGR00730 family)|nr:TIGR00730 family Rossman fold protein [Candidatus Nomurabacteria bacterium]
MDEFDKIVEKDDKNDPLAKMRAKKAEREHDDRFATFKKPSILPQLETESWANYAGEFQLKGSNYFRSMRYAKDIDKGLQVLEDVPKGVSVFGSRFPEEKSVEYEQARDLAKKLAQTKHVVITGGGPGIMEAANRGAFEVGGQSIGLKISLPGFDEPANPYVTKEATFQYFFARKVMLVKASNAYVFFPGGYGTLDEFTEVLVLLQERKMPPAPIFLFGSSYWQGLDKFIREQINTRGYLNEGDMELYTITDSVDEIVAAINQRQLEQ